MPAAGREVAAEGAMPRWSRRWVCWPGRGRWRRTRRGWGRATEGRGESGCRCARRGAAAETRAGAVTAEVGGTVPRARVAKCSDGSRGQNTASSTSTIVSRANGASSPFRHPPPSLPPCLLPHSPPAHRLARNGCRAGRRGGGRRREVESTPEYGTSSLRLLPPSPRQSHLTPSHPLARCLSATFFSFLLAVPAPEGLRGAGVRSGSCGRGGPAWRPGPRGGRACS